MQLADFYDLTNGQVVFTRDKASAFAKNIADDFNPLHDPEAKLFCVPGDLLFAVALERYGISERMRFVFSGMVDGGVQLDFPKDAGDKIEILDQAGKSYLHVERSGTVNRDAGAIETLTRNYVEFSGHTFPHILVPLMAEHGVMINPARPLVIYESMEITLTDPDTTAPTLEYSGATLESNGKKGNVRLAFRLTQEGREVGEGAKYMLLRGLKPYDKTVVEQVVEEYMALKAAFKKGGNSAEK
jgi:hypothetical protein